MGCLTSIYKPESEVSKYMLYIFSFALMAIINLAVTSSYLFISVSG